MGRQNIYSTMSVASLMPPPVVHDLIDFLVNNRQSILSPLQKTELLKTRFSSHTPISEIVHRITAPGKEQTFSLLRVPSKTTVLNEAVDMTFVPFDILQMKEVSPTFLKSLSLLPELNDRIVLNITDLTKANGEFSDITLFHWRMVRDFLSRSFYTSTGNSWISPILVRYVAKVYSMTLGGQIARIFGLTALPASFVQTLFALFFVGKMTSPEVSHDFMKAHHKELGLYDLGALTQVLAFVEDQLQHKCPLTLEEVFQVINADGHSQLQNEAGVSRLNRSILNVRFGSLYSEKPVSAIALEYPPYFFFLILLVLSNVRIGLSIYMKTLNLDREGKQVVEQLLKSPVLTSGL